jgi:hypothetical protein
MSFCVLFASYINYYAPILIFCSWLSSLLAIGYLSTPSGSWNGKLAFTGVCVMVIGIGFKLLHLPGANVLIIAGIAVIGTVYIFLWIKNRSSKSL